MRDADGTVRFIDMLTTCPRRSICIYAAITFVDLNINTVEGIILTDTGGQISTDLGNGSTTAGQTHEMRFRELSSNGTNYVGFKAPDTLGANQIWRLPSADGSNFDTLYTDGAGTTSWSNVVASELIYEVYDTGTQTVNGTPTAISFDTERFASTNFALAAGVVTVSQAGTYSIDYSVSCDSTNGTRDTVLCEVYINGVVLVGSSSYTYNRNTANGEATANKRVLVALSASDTVEVRVDLISGAGNTTIANGSNLILERKGN